MTTLTEPGRATDTYTPPELANQAVHISNVPLAVPVTLQNIIVGSEVRVALASNGTELFLTNAATSTASFLTKTYGTVNITVRKAGYVESLTQGVIDGVAGLTAFISQVVDGTA